MAHVVILRKDSDIVLELQSLTDSVTSAAITTAMVTARVVSSSGTAVSGATWPISLPHVGSGTYRGYLPYSMQIGRDQLFVEVTADAGTNRKSKWVIPATITTA